MVGRFSRLSSVTSPRDRVWERVCARARRDPSPTCEMQCLARCRWGHKRARRRAAVRSCHQRLAGRLSRFTEWRLMTVRPRWRGRHLVSTSTWSDPPGADVAAVEEGRSGGWLAGFGGGGGGRREGRDPPLLEPRRPAVLGCGRHFGRARRAWRQLAHPAPPRRRSAPRHDTAGRPCCAPPPSFPARPTPPHPTTAPPSLRHWPERGGGASRTGSQWVVVASEAAVEARSRASAWGCPPALEAGLAGATESSPRALRRPGRILQPPCAAVCAAAQLRAVLVAPCHGGGDGCDGVAGARHRLW